MRLVQAVNQMLVSFPFSFLAAGGWKGRKGSKLPRSVKKQKNPSKSSLTTPLHLTSDSDLPPFYSSSSQ